MKDFDKSSIFTGVLLLALASLFSISLILQPLDFGMVGPGHNNIFFKLGHLLYSVYGFSSIFIPVFLLVSGLSCFASKWSARKTMRLVTALIPFFTCVVTENLCRSLIEMGDSEFLAVKVAVVAITGAMLVIIEFLGSGIIADKITMKKGSGTYKEDESESELEGEFSEDFDFSDDDFIEEDGDLKGSEENHDNSEDNLGFSAEYDDNSENEENDNDDGTEKVTNHRSSPSIFDDAIPTTVFPLHYDDTPSDNASDDFSTDFSNDFIEEKEDEKESENEEVIKNNVEEVIEETLSEKNNNDYDDFAEKVPTVEELEEKIRQEIREEEKMKEAAGAANNSADDSSSVITQEEFAALTDPIAPADELEWPNLMPEVKELPPDYSSDFDENDPALEFPPKDEAEDSVNENSQESDSSADKKTEAVEDEINIPELDVEIEDNDEALDEIEAESDDKTEALEPEAELEDYQSDENDDISIDIDDISDDSDKDDESEELVDQEKEESENINDKSEEPKNPKNIEEIRLPSIDDDFDDTFIEDADEDDPEEIEDDFSTIELDAEIDEEMNLEPDLDIDSDENSEAEKEFGIDKINLDFGDVFKVEGDEKDKKSEETEENNDDIDLDFGDFGLGLMDDDKPKKTEEPKAEKSEPHFSSAAPANPKFPNRIVIHDGTEKEEEDEDKKLQNLEKKNLVGSKFPNRIKLDDDLPEEDDSGITFFSERNDSEEDLDNDEYEDDVTLPMPEFDVEEDVPAGISDDFTEEYEPEDLKNFEYAENLDEELTETNEIPESESIDDIVLDDEGFLGSTSKGEAVHFNGSDVFSEMEEDIRKDQEEKMAVQHDDFLPPTINRATKRGPYIIPSDLLIAYKDDKYWVIDEDTKQDAANLKQTLAEFNIDADVIGIKKGPVVTMFEILPAPGVRLNKIVALQDNIALSLAAQSVRIVAPIPGKQAVGIEVPNKKRSVVGFRELIETPAPEWDKMAVPVVLGKDILGKSQIIDLVKTPHMLIAGATGSGKSVCVNSLILSILFKRSYKDVKLILVDPKVVELKLYNDIPHLLTPVITEPKKALKALQYCLCEMERRYALLDGMGVRDISNYNQKIKEQNICTEKLPYIVVIIDEFADLMATSGKELESIVARLTAMSRAVGIHLVLATQRPSVNVITGLIKANIPTRIAFMVASRTDSNIIIDSVGAEKLLGRGDMLYASAVDPAPIRIQGTFVSDQEVEDVVKAVKEYGEPDYLDDSIFDEDEEARGTDLFGEPVSDDDPLYDQALEIVVQAGKASASYIQRKLKIGYNRAARLVEEMEDRGIVGPANGSKPREIIHMP